MKTVKWKNIDELAEYEATHSIGALNLSWVLEEQSKIIQKLLGGRKRLSQIIESEKENSVKLKELKDELGKTKESHLKY